MRAILPLLVWAVFSFSGALSTPGADFNLQEAKENFIKGEYQKVLEQTSQAIEDRGRGEELHLLHATTLWMLGRYPEAAESISLSRRMYYPSVRLRLLGHQIYRSAGDSEKASEALDEINLLGGSRRWGDPADIVALGRAAVLLGADPRRVLDNFFNTAKEADPDLRDIYLAIGQLALDKHDFALAGQAFQEGLARFRNDPDLLYGLAAALEPDNRKEMLKTLEKALEANPNHIQGRLLLTDHLVDAEEYDEALKELEKVEKVNPHRPEMWAYRGVIAHLRNQPEEEKKARDAGLKFWKNNPVVDHLLGLKLSQKYRFAEGAGYQRQALKFDPKYLPAKNQLAQDLLRLGIEEEGWKLAQEVAEADPYDVAAYNLVTLHDTMAKFATLTNEHFILRMSTHEAAIYGEDALELLEKARVQLSKKYGLEIERPVTVEIFPEQKDFAVRTFGMPGGEGYLGVCFGNVVTANSPASHTMNWPSVLWHEFCHVVTLNLTRNKMPRWLSEGISVYEERRADPRWGEQMTPRYREMILEGELKPISELSGAFMAPPSGLHLQFAYYQSSLVVEFLIERFGLEPLRAILRGLGEGQPINDALVAHTAPMEELEQDFEAFAEGAAEALGPETQWAKPERDLRGNIEAAWAALHPDNIHVLQEQAEAFIEKEEWAEAIPLLEKSIRLYPRQNGSMNAYQMLAQIYRKQGEVDKEKKALAEAVKWDAEPKEALLRLIELQSTEKDYASVRKHGRLLLEVDPLLPQLHRALGIAEEEEGSDAKALSAFHTVLRLNPPDPADLHFRLARLLHKQGSAEARRHILLALQDAPRFREGHKLLLDIIEPDEQEELEESAPAKEAGNAVAE